MSYRPRHFEHSEYEDDPLVRVFNHDYAAEKNEVWVPARLWRRIQAIGIGYEMHYLPLLGGEGPEVRTFNSTQCETIAEELRTVGNIIEDPLLESQLVEILEIVDGARGLGESALSVEGP